MNKPQSPAWEEWQLTAFVLRELDDETSAQIKLAAANDAALAQQLHGLRHTLEQAREVLQAEAQVEAAEHQRSGTAFVTKAVIAKPPRRNRLKVIGLLAMAASLMITMFVASQAVFQPLAMNETAAIAQRESSAQESSAVRAEIDKRSQDMLGKLPISSKPPYVVESTSGPIQSPDSLSIVSGSGQGGYGGEGGGYGSGIASDAMMGGYGGSGYGDAGGGMGAYGGGMQSSPGAGGPGGSPAPKRSLNKNFGWIPNQSGAGESGGYGAGNGREHGGVGATPYPKFQTPRIIIEDEAKFAESPTSGYSGGGYGQVGESITGPHSELTNLRQRHNGGRFDRTTSGERYDAIVENDFQTVDTEPLSTFSIDVDSASYTKCRQLLLELSRRPPPEAVRIEEFINYFEYEYAGPLDDKPFAAHLAVAACPWQPQHKLVRIALQAKKVDLAQRPAANVVFLLDVSGSMNEPNKLPLVQDAMRMLAGQLGEQDRVAIVVYAGAAGCVLEGTRGDHQPQILAAIDKLRAGGSTNGGQGIQLAYQLARDSFIPGGINRVVLCTDGDFNVGVTSTAALVELVAENAKSNIFLTVLGFGSGNTNDAMMEQISNRGNGVYGFVDSRREAHHQMVNQLAGNLMTVAKDVKIQVEFNPTKVKSYRLIGYENRMLATKDFNDDKKDAGEIGAGHRVTALYEIVPVGAENSRDEPIVDELRYQPKSRTNPEPPGAVTASQTPTETHDELLAVKLRTKQPEGETSQLLTFPLTDSNVQFSQADRDFQWAATVAQFGMLLRGSRYAGQANWKNLLEQAIEVAGVNPDAARQEFLEMIRKCQR